MPGSHCSRFGFNFVINNICFENNKYLTFLSPVLGGRGEGAGAQLEVEAVDVRGGRDEARLEVVYRQLRDLFRQQMG